MISKTHIRKRTKKKTNSSLVRTINLARKHSAWQHIAQQLSGSTRRHSSVNLSDIDRETKEGDTVIIIGKVLGSGVLSKKVRVCALGYSESAREKLKKSKAEIVKLDDEIQKNTKATGVKVLA